MRHISGAVQCGEAAQGNPGGLFLVRIYASLANKPLLRCYRYLIQSETITEISSLIRHPVYHTIPTQQ